ncbi:putative PEP-binding protein [Rhizobium leguminosarum]|uniref:putative PEP-binding protein n=1 Tax=Rhizobium leguminosarum TaxID=384 RepID=UPI0003F906A6|nr:putative PEP-binding protein [Rhizobium leguminosarum]
MIEYLYRSIESARILKQIPVNSHSLSPGSFSGVLKDIRTVGDYIYLVDDGRDFDMDVLSRSKGVIARGVSPGSHLAIICRTKGVPAVSISTESFGVLRDLLGVQLVYDTSHGRLCIGSATNVEPQIDRHIDELNHIIGQHSISLKVNAETGPEIEGLRNLNYAGIGVYRIEHALRDQELATELSDLVRGTATSSGERKIIDFLLQKINEICEQLKGRSLVIRTVDPPKHELVGLDATKAETNPMMGVRGVRLLLENDRISSIHREVLRNLTGQPVSILLPFVMSNREAEYCVSHLNLDRLGFPVGVMIELPSAAFDQFSTDAFQFLSFGTNDLSQLTLGLSRDDFTPARFPDVYFNETLLRSPFTDLHPAVKELIKRSLGANPDLHSCICGEHAASTDTIRFCLENGIKELSVAPGMVPQCLISMKETLAA